MKAEGGSTNSAHCAAADAFHTQWTPTDARRTRPRNFDRRGTSGKSRRGARGGQGVRGGRRTAGCPWRHRVPRHPACTRNRHRATRHATPQQKPPNNAVLRLTIIGTPCCPPVTGTGRLILTTLILIPVGRCNSKPLETDFRLELQCDIQYPHLQVANGPCSGRVRRLRFAAAAALPVLSGRARIDAHVRRVQAAVLPAV